MAAGAGSRETLGTAGGFESSEPTPNDTLPPVKPQFPNLHQQWHQLGTIIQMPEMVGGIFQSNYHIPLLGHLVS